MRKTLKTLFIIFALVLLVSCNGGKKEEVKLPDLAGYSKQQVEMSIGSLKKDVNLSFEYEYSDDIEPNRFIKYKGSFNAGDVVTDGLDLTVIIASSRYALPNLNGKTEADITTLLNQVKLDYPTLNLTYSFEYTDSTKPEGEFVSYKAPFYQGDVLKINDSITILISQDKFRLPDIVGMNKQQIIAEFDYLLDGFPELDLVLNFEYVYSDTLEDDVFESYEVLVANDPIIQSRTITINLAKSYEFPDLSGMYKSEIEDLFDDMLSSVKGHSIVIEYKYFYPFVNDVDAFVSYLQDDEFGEKILKDQRICVGIMGAYAKYPDIANKTEEQIETMFDDLFSSYFDNDYYITYEDVYNPSYVDGSIVEYADVAPGNNIESKDNIVIIRTFKTLILPNLRGYKLPEIIALFKDLNIDEDRLTLMPDYSDYVAPGEFIKYGEGKAGDAFDISAKRLVIHYDIRPILPDLSYMNKKQIEEALGELHILVTFEYVVDNTMEYDLFKEYKDYEIGDPVLNDMDVVVTLFSNDDVNVGDDIVSEHQLFISKYIDSGGNNQGIELYNGTNEEINLEDYYIAILSGGTFVPAEEIRLNGTLASKTAYLIVHANAKPELLNKSDMQTSLMKFGGSASIQLRRTSNDTYIDSIYEVGNISVLMDNEIFVRREHITHGRRDYRYLEWMGFVNDFYDLLKVHPYPGATDPVFELIEDKTFQQYGMTLVKYLRRADGDTVYFESLDPRDTASYDGNNRVRFLLVNTPETEKPGQEGQPYAQVASDFTHNMLSNAVEIYLQASVEAGITDTYDRHLGLIWANVGTIEEPNWKLLNYELIKNGLGEMMIAKTGKYYDNPIFANRHLYQWAADALEFAKANKLGLYSGVHRP